MHALRLHLVAPLALALLLGGCGTVVPSGDGDGGVPFDAGSPPPTDGGDDAGSASDAGSADAGAVDAGGADGGQPDAGPVDGGVPDAGPAAGDGGLLPDPILFLHGINGSAADWDVMRNQLIADGWPADRLMARTFSDPGYGCNVDNAQTVKAWADELLAATGATRLDVVAHSMGTLSSRYYLKHLGGKDVINTYVTLGGMNHGLWPPCASPLDVCVWKELCAIGPFITDLNTAPASPGPAVSVSIAGGADTVVAASSSQLDGAENLSVPGVTHAGAGGLQQAPSVYVEVKRVLQYPGH